MKQSSPNKLQHEEVEKVVGFGTTTCRVVLGMIGAGCGVDVENTIEGIETLNLSTREPECIKDSDVVDDLTLDEVEEK